MESLTHSRLGNKASGVLPRKASNVNNGGCPAKTMYDDVDRGPPNFGFTTLLPRAEDYSEIFSGFHASRVCSIPVLDLPLVDETQVGLDVCSSDFNYHEIFGGFNGLDFGIFYEDLLSGLSDGRDGYASDEAWALADTETSSEETEPYGNNPILSNEDHYKSFDGKTEFNISYHKANQTRNEVMSSGRTDVTQLHAIPGYSLLYDETASVEKSYPQLQVTGHADSCTNFMTGKMKSDHQAKTKSQTAHCNFFSQTPGNDLTVLEILTRNSSCSDKNFVTVSEIALKTRPCQIRPPSRPPPPIDARKEDSCRFSSNSIQNTYQRRSDDNSPPFFDVEIDVSSSASASACSMEEPMGNAQEQLGCVKRLAVKKKVTCEKVKPGPKCVVVGNEGSRNEIGDRLDDLDFEERRCIYKRRHDRSKVSINAGLIGAKTKQEIHDPLEEDILFDIEETFSSSQWSSGSTISGTRDFVNKSEMPKKGQIFLQDMDIRECAGMERKDSIDEADSQVNTVREIDHPSDYEGKHKARKELCQHMEITRQERSADVEYKKRDAKTETGGTCPSKKEKKENKVKLVHNCVETKEKTSQTNPSLQVQSTMKDQQVENKLTEGENWKRAELKEETENHLKFKEYVREQGLDKLYNMRVQEEAGGRRDRKQRKEAVPYQGQVDNRERQKNGMEPTKKVVRLEESSEQEAEKHDEAYRNDIEKTLQNVHHQKQNENKPNVPIERNVNHKNSIEGVVQEESPIVSLQNEDIVKGLKVELHEEETKKVLTDTLVHEENVRIVEDACENDEDKNRVEEAGSFQTSKKQVSESKRKQLVEKETKVDADNECSDVANLEQEGLNEIVNQIECNEEEKKLNCARKIQLHGEYVELMVSDGAWTVEGRDNLQEHSTRRHKQDSGRAAESQDFVADRECGKSMSDSEIKVNILQEGLLENQAADAHICIPSIITEDLKRGIFSENEANISLPFNGNLNTVGDTDICLEQMQNLVNENVRPIFSGPKNPEENFNDDSVGRQKRDQHVSNTVDKEELRDKLDSGNSGVNFQNQFKIGASVSTILEGKENAQLPVQKCNLTTTVENEYEMAREREMEIDHLRKLEEEREREREREKDRMAVGKASLEGHCKAHAEARERAEREALERAAAESRQRLLAEARERLEKACAEAKAKSFSGKMEAEARLKADRAALDRARAERAATEAREQLERSVSDVRDEQFQSASSRFAYSSTGASSFVEKSGGVEGESAKRCRARLERYRRTAEQAAKALAEKNMRDLLAQKEQAERNRISETLDAEVKRWSSGKEGNLRALLSTLQYILGPYSGWQPIPLTDVVTSAAVKKAYRKATLCVHPDKLQQRGASIQQKYICEKVFDLLKDAWNTFNSEER